MSMMKTDWTVMMMPKTDTATSPPRRTRAMFMMIEKILLEVVSRKTGMPYFTISASMSSEGLGTVNFRSMRRSKNGQNATMTEMTMASE